ncbi:Potassium-transporting ATPase C chain [Leptospira interrogans serovar Manilae]|uniref:Potassium-transporting ATPase KdpC subunit n=1 Tax=Leptospira interrogans serovar Manilae TaxID=214675 RepID=A0AAQ1P2W2_LEPIR|nr:potassium-transporting ATPase subunit KdpC [Leptospira interrogans]AKP25323.1 ATPase [Leptospira interrogans serovar Manilae]AKP29108.1 ATPase [Leptospira interrogans serovar Manilae]EYU62424.1 ATPase [Leptospira interrogans serovar Manilae]SOR62822.1 Potassium-transporting ATPase C chain [Leptospira interrogans serovar Manilae]
MIFLNIISISIRLLLILTLITGILYPIVTTGFAERFFPFRSSGSRVVIQGKIVGSELIAQKFIKDEYFWPRPSAMDYAAGASNLSVTNVFLKTKVEERKKFLLEKHPEQTQVPPDLLFASGSGLDPHISPNAALFQINRVAKSRKLTEGQILRLKNIVEESVEKGYIGENRINVLLLNLKLDSEFGIILK